MKEKISKVYLKRTSSAAEFEFEFEFCLTVDMPLNKTQTQTQTLQPKSLQSGKKNLGSQPCKIFRTILKMNKGGTPKNRPKDKKVDDDALRTYIRDRVCREKKEGVARIDNCVNASIHDTRIKFKRAKKDSLQQPVPALAT